jgi:hypothetical protein
MAGRHGRTKKAIRPWRNKLDICMRLTMQSFGDFEAPRSKSPTRHSRYGDGALRGMRSLLQFNMPAGH